MRLFTLFASVVFVLTSLPFQLMAQQDEITETEWKEWTRGTRMVKTTGPNVQVEGSPYFNAEWTQGNVHLDSGNQTGDIPLRYNTFSNQLEFKRNGKVLIAKPDMVTAFSLKDDKGNEALFKNGFRSQEYDISSDLFLRVIHDGKVKLAAKHKTDFYKAHSVDPIDGTKTSKYIPKKDYFLLTDDGRFRKVKLKRKHILGALSDDTSGLKSFVRQNNLDFGNEEDLGKILSHYETLRP